jgi:putative ABC transport system ATP-binding protein
VHRPRIVFADEPTGNLSSEAGRKVMEFLRRSVDELDQTLLLVTHNPRDACFADELHFLIDGSLQEQATLQGEEIHEDRIAACMEKLGI